MEGCGFCGDAWRGSNEGIGLVLVVDVDIAASFEIVCRTSYRNFELFQRRRFDVELPIA
jgi:hypothetical protein